MKEVEFLILEAGFEVNYHFPSGDTIRIKEVNAKTPKEAWFSTQAFLRNMGYEGDPFKREYPCNSYVSSLKSAFCYQCGFSRSNHV